MIEYFWNSHVFFTLATKIVLNLGDFPMKNVVKFFGIPMSSLGGVHLISGITHLVCNHTRRYRGFARRNMHVCIRSRFCPAAWFPFVWRGIEKNNNNKTDGTFDLLRRTI